MARWGKKSWFSDSAPSNSDGSGNRMHAMDVTVLRKRVRVLMNRWGLGTGVNTKSEAGGRMGGLRWGGTRWKKSKRRSFQGFAEGHTHAPVFTWKKRNTGWRSKSDWRHRSRAVRLGNALKSGTSRDGGVRKPRKPLRKRTKLLFILLIIIGLIVPSMIYVEKNLRHPLMHVAKARVKQISTQAINKAITEQVAQQSDTERLIDWSKDNNGKISGFMMNYAEHMRITSQTIQTVQTTLNEIHQIPEHIPLGHALDSAFISSFGPRIPVRFEPLGAVKVELNTRQSNAGINMILVEVYIHITAEVTIVIPFDVEAEVVETQIPISYLLVVGDVPMYYYDGSGKPVGDTAQQAPSIAVPMLPGVGEVGAGGSGGMPDGGGSGAGEGSSEGGVPVSGTLGK